MRIVFNRSHRTAPNAFGRGRGRGPLNSLKARLLIAAVFAAVALGTYYFNTQTNPVTGQKERVALNIPDEVRFGLAAVPELSVQFGGRSRDVQAQQHVQEVGRKLANAIPAVYREAREIPWEFSFTLLADDQTVNAFALPGGPTFITEALYRQLETEGQLAGVMGHEIGHVLERHGAERMAKQQLAQGLTGAAVMASGDPNAGQIAGMVADFVQMSYGRGDELESDAIGLSLMTAAGYDPRSMIRVMEILKQASGGDSGGRSPEWASTHPDPDNRVARIEQHIRTMFPNGVPESLEP
jgi:predicted Zn-dependent protease